MDYVIQFLELEKRAIERSIWENDMMHTDIKKATLELSKITELKKAVKVLKLKNRKR